MAKYYLTWGIGYGSKLLAEKNALRNANISGIEITGLKKLEIPKVRLIDLKTELKGKASGIILKRCVKGAAAVSLVFGITEDKIYIGKGKAGSLQKAVRKANAEISKKLKLEGTQQLAASAEAQKGKYSCAVVALIIK